MWLCPPCCSDWTYCVCGEFRGVVIDVSNPDDSGGSVGQAIGGVAFHVCSLDDQSVLGDFLQTEEIKNGMKHYWIDVKTFT